MQEMRKFRRASSDYAERCGNEIEKGRGCLGKLFWLFLFWPMLRLRRKKYKTKNSTSYTNEKIAVCNNCGHSWKLVKKYGLGVLNMEEKRKRKPRGMRPDKRIQVSFTDGRKPDGSPNRLYFYGHTRAEAEAARDQYKEFKKAGLRYEDRKMTLNEWVDKWVVMYDVDLNDYGPYVKRLRDDLGRYELRGIREGQLVESLSAYAGKSKSGATKYRMIVKQVFHRAHRNGLIANDPASDLDLPDDLTDGSHRALERWEIDCIMENWRAYPAGRWAMVMLFCGLRRGEMIALDWSCVDLENRTLTVEAAVSFKNRTRTIKDTKSAAGMRVLPISEPLFKMLSETAPSLRSGPVCLSASGRAISADTVRKNWQTYCRAMTNVLNGREAIHPGQRKRTDKASDKVAGAYNSLLCESWDNVEAERVFLCDMHDLRHPYVKPTTKKFATFFEVFCWAA